MGKTSPGGIAYNTRTWEVLVIVLVIVLVLLLGLVLVLVLGLILVLVLVIVLVLVLGLVQVSPGGPASSDADDNLVAVETLLALPVSSAEIAQVGAAAAGLELHVQDLHVLDKSLVRVHHANGTLVHALRQGRDSHRRRRSSGARSVGCGRSRFLRPGPTQPF